MKLTNAGIENLEELKSLGYGVPEYDREQDFIKEVRKTLDSLL